MNVFARSLLVAGIAVAATPVLAAGDEGFQAAFSPVASGESAAAADVAAPEAAPADESATPSVSAGSGIAEATVVESTEPAGGEGIPAEFQSEAVVPATPEISEPVATEETPEAIAEREQQRAERAAHRGPYVGMSGGTDHVALASVRNGTSSGVVAGYRLSEMLAVELAANYGDYRAPGIGPDCLFDNRFYALYAAARSSGGFYLKGRAGVLSETLEPDATCAGTLPLEDVVGSVGVGAGVRLGSAALEFEYTLIDEDIYRVGWSLLLNF
jgi:hypothetical protein